MRIAESPSPFADLLKTPNIHSWYGAPSVECNRTQVRDLINRLFLLRFRHVSVDGLQLASLFDRDTQFVLGSFADPQCESSLPDTSVSLHDYFAFRIEVDDSQLFTRRVTPGGLRCAFGKWFFTVNGIEFDFPLNSSSPPLTPPKVASVVFWVHRASFLTGQQEPSSPVAAQEGGAEIIEIPPMWVLSQGSR